MFDDARQGKKEELCQQNLPPNNVFKHSVPTTASKAHTFNLILNLTDTFPYNSELENKKSFF